MITKTGILIENFLLESVMYKNVLKIVRFSKSQILLIVDNQFNYFLYMKEGHYLYISFYE